MTRMRFVIRIITMTLYSLFSIITTSRAFFVRAMLRPFCAVVVTASILSACSSEPEKPKPLFLPVALNDVQELARYDQRGALLAFARHCVQGKFTDFTFTGTTERIVQVGEWKALCDKATAIVPKALLSSDHQSVLMPPSDAATNDAVDAGFAREARHFFTSHFTPHRMFLPDRTDGLVTGYFVPILQARKTADARFRYPLYASPKRTEPDEPFFTRAQIDAGALAGYGLEIAWLEDPVDRFFLQVQGSGILRLADGSLVRAGYSGHNSHPYHAIGKTVIAMGEISAEAMSYETLRDWLRRNPEKAETVMQSNPRYIFFALSEDIAARGSAGVALSPMRSLAIDPDYLPYGAPVSLRFPYNSIEGVQEILPPVMAITQDTGSAIKGAMRGDVFFGYGEAQGLKAGALQHRAEWIVWLPKTAYAASQ